MAYQPENFDHLLGTPGFSNDLLSNHFTLYQGYVTNANKILERLAEVSKEGAEYAELKRRFGWEFNGMRLHELYFGNMSKTTSNPANDSILQQKIGNDFGTFDDWRSDFVATGKMRGIGWVVLTFDPVGDRFLNIWINEHDVGHLSTSYPLLIMDVFEHAFMLDYGIKRADYINAFMFAIDWAVVEERFKIAARL